MTRRGMVVAAQPEAAEAGLDILRLGGNAVDAAIACGLVQTVIDPLMCGIAGFGSMAVFMPSKSVHEYVDFHSPAPLSATPTMWENIIEAEARDGFGFVLKGRVNDLGPKSICVPATLKAFGDAWKRYGCLPWADLVQSAIFYAEKGWMVRPAVHLFWSDAGDMGRTANYERVAFSQTGREIYCRSDGRPKVTGELVRNPDYGRTLRQIAAEGVDCFYHGQIADQIVSDMTAAGALLQRRDLEEYQPVISQPLSAEYRGYHVTTNQPPGGGIMLLQMLNTLSEFDLLSIGHNTPDYLCLLSEVMKRATIDKDKHVGDPRFVNPEFITKLISKDYTAGIAQDIRRGVRAEVPRLTSPTIISKDTTQVCVVDGDGNCVSMTHSLGAPSGVITNGLGFMYNGSMAVFDPRPGRAGSIAPGKSRFSAMCPSIVFKDGKPWIVLGAPGGTQIVMGVLQTLLNSIDFGMPMLQSVAAPRFSSTSNAIDVVNRIPRSITRLVKARGYEVIRNPFGYSIGWVHGIRILPDGLDGAADPGRDGVALECEL